MTEKYILHEKLAEFELFKKDNPTVFEYLMAELEYSKHLKNHCNNCGKSFHKLICDACENKMTLNDIPPCKRHHLLWVAEEDKRLQCKICKRIYVIDNGNPVKVVDENGNDTFEI